MDLVLDNLKSLICHKTQPTNQPTLTKYSILEPNLSYSFFRANLVSEINAHSLLPYYWPYAKANQLRGLIQRKRKNIIVN